MVVRNLNEPYYLTLPEDRAAILLNLGIDHVVTLNFTPTMRNTSPSKFLAWVKEHLSFSRLVVGEDFALGRDREGGAQSLKVLGDSMGYSTEIVPPATDENNEKISSSSIRKLIREGEIAKAEAHLTRKFTLRECSLVKDNTLPTGTNNRIFQFTTQPMFMLPGAGVYAGILQNKTESVAVLVDIPYPGSFSVPESLVFSGRVILSTPVHTKWEEECADIILYPKIRAWSPWGDAHQIHTQIEKDFKSITEVINSYA